jgi:hypothetical protein
MDAGRRAGHRPAAQHPAQQIASESGVILRAASARQALPDTKGGKTMKITLILAATATYLAVDLPVVSQAEETQVFIAATYFHCNAATVMRADDAVANQYKIELDNLVKSKELSSWGWLGKIVGGEPVRAGYLTASSLQVLLNATDKSAVVRSDGHPPKMEARTLEESCSSGEDYIWRVLAGSDPRAPRGKYAFSTYFVCDQNREAQADASVKSVLGPKYDKLVAAKKLNTWTWAEHIVGGKYQRLSTMTAQSVAALIAAREALVAASDREPVDAAIASSCGSHQDFIWELLSHDGP